MIKLFAAFFLFLNITLSSQILKPDIIKQDFLHFRDSGIALITSPFNFSNDDWAKTDVYTSATIGLFAFDKSINDFALKNQSDTGDKIFDIDKFYGNKYTLFYSLFLYSGGYFLDNAKLRKMGLNATEAFFYSGSITTILKGLIGRERPFGQKNNLSFKPLQFSDDHFFSLPSGHATISFAVSTVMAKSLNNIYWKTFWYGSATLVCVSRIYHNRHWVSDVFLGGVIGYEVGNFMVNYPVKKNKNNIKLNFGYRKILLTLYF